MDSNYNNQMNKSFSSNSNGLKKMRSINNNQGIRPPVKNQAIQRPKNENSYLKISAEVYHFKTKGELVFDLKTNKLTWTLKGEKDELYIKKYGDQKEININKDEIKEINLKDI